MNMVPVYIFVLHYEIWHLTESHLFHILMGKSGEINITQFIIRMRIQ